MIKLDNKYVFHIPCYKHNSNHELVLIDRGDIIDSFINYLKDNGYDSLYMNKVKSYYNKRYFDEIIITLFTTDDDKAEKLFIKWFKENNDILEQEALAYEHNNNMIIESLK